MRKVMAFGAFDILHPGHLYYLGEAKKLGDELIVVVATDSNIAKVKGARPLNDQEQRLEVVRAVKSVDDALLGSEENMFEIISEHRPEAIALGYDQKVDEMKLKEFLENEKINSEIVRIGAFEADKNKSSIIKKRIQGN
ncbi:MAG: adenylyltransferase/cytidyltransferase family protein [Candidatus Diapherotrites archaeon]